MTTIAARGPTDPLTEVLEDLAAESDLLDSVVSGLDVAGWRTQTPAEGWDITRQIAHLAWTDEVAVAAAVDEARWQAALEEASTSPVGFVDAAAAEVAAAGRDAVLERWRCARTAVAEVLASYPPGRKIPWFGPPMSATSMATARFMETWAHTHDVADALGRPTEPTGRIRHVVHLGVQTRDFAFATHRLAPPEQEFRVELTAPDGERWVYGPDGAAQTVRGPAYDFCLLVTRRRHRLDLDLEAVGADAARWLEIAQAFAGPPGPGREPQVVS